MSFTYRNRTWYRDGEPTPACPLSYGADSIPREVAEEAYKEYVAQFGSCQSLDRLNERGGFGSAELALYLYERIKRHSDLSDETHNVLSRAIQALLNENTDPAEDKRIRAVQARLCNLKELRCENI